MTTPKATNPTVTVSNQNIPSHTVAIAAQTPVTTPSYTAASKAAAAAKTAAEKAPTATSKGTSGGGTFTAPAEPNPLNSKSLTGFTSVVTKTGTAGGGKFAAPTPTVKPKSATPKSNAKPAKL